MERFMEKLKHILKKTAGFVLKIAIAAAIIWYLASKHHQKIAAALKNFNYFYLAAAMLVYFLHIAVCSFRWYELCKMLGFKLSFSEALSLTMQAYFFSLVIPGGAISGDVVKIGVLSTRTASGNRLEGAFSILMDRIIGMIALFVLILILLPLSGNLLLSVNSDALPLSREVKVWGIAGLYLLCLAGLAASGAIFFHRFIEKMPLLGTLMHWGDRITHGMVRRICDATDEYSRQWKKLSLLTVMTSLFVHIDIVVAMYILFKGMAGFDLGFFPVLVAGIIGALIGLVPIFPAGVGGREWTTTHILIAGGMSEGMAYGGPLIFMGIILFFSLCGGLFFIFDPGRKKSGHELPGELEK